MNDQTIKLLRDLAEKLGTTTEMLWGCLVKQGPIWEYSELFIGVILLVAWIFLLRIK